MVWLFSNIFKENGYEVFGCYDGSSALKQVRKIKPKVVLLDYNLPDMNGVEVLGKLHKIGHGYIKGIIMVSGTADSEVEKKAKKAGVFAYLSKPVDLGRLLITVKNVIEKGLYTGTGKRKFPRKEEELKIEYGLWDDLDKKKLTKRKFTHSRDISGGGLCIYVNENIDFGEDAQLYIIINLPEQKKIFTIVKVVYVNPAEEGYKSRIGVRYLEMMEEDRLAIMNRIEGKEGGVKVAKNKKKSCFEKSYEGSTLNV